MITRTVLGGLACGRRGAALRLRASRIVSGGASSRFLGRSCCLSGFSRESQDEIHNRGA